MFYPANAGSGSSYGAPNPKRRNAQRLCPERSGPLSKKNSNGSYEQPAQQAYPKQRGENRSPDASPRYYSN